MSRQQLMDSEEYMDTLEHNGTCTGFSCETERRIKILDLSLKRFVTFKSNKIENVFWISKVSEC